MSTRTLIRVTVGSVLAIAAVGSTARAQGGAPAAGGPPPSTTQMVLKGKAPVSSNVLPVKLPRPRAADLANGLHLIVLEDRSLPQITFQMIIPGAGGYFDPPDKIGLAAYTAQMMREGTKTRTSSQIAETLETISASLTVTSSVSGVPATLAGSSLTEHFGTVMDLTADLLLNPTFPSAEWDRLKNQARAGLVQNRTNPGFLAAETINRAVFGTHPAARVATTAASLDAITVEALAAFHKAHYAPDHAVMAFAGDISLAEARTAVETKLAGWTKGGVSKPSVTDPAPIGPAGVFLVARPGSVQTTLSVGTQSIARTDPDYTALTVVNRVLGQTMGRLFRHLREEKGYTYGIGSSFSATQYRGIWQSNTSVRTEVTEPALTDLLAEIADLRDRPIPAAELADIKRAIVGSFALALENPQQVLGYYLESWQYGLPQDYWDTYPSRVMAVTAEQAQAAARKYWAPGRLQIVAVGDAVKITGALKKLGEVRAFDADGNPLK
jgi:zinc protease